MVKIMNDAYKMFLKMQRESKRKDIYSNYDREELLDLIIEQEDKLEELDEKILEYKEKYYDKCYECDDLVKKIEYISNICKEQKNRIDKAIWYINRCKEYHRIHHHEEKMYPDELISLELILKGEWEDLGEDNE